MNSLLLSMPGTPVIYYGDEIGMGDNIHLGDRNGVRTPMQWSPDRNGGFSRADPAGAGAADRSWTRSTAMARSTSRRKAAIRIPFSTGCAGCSRCAAGIRRSAAAPDASFIRRTAKSLPTCANTTATRMFCVANVAHSPQAVELDLSQFAGRVPVELNAGSLFPPIGELTYLLTLPPYGFYWFALANERAMADMAHAGARAAAGIS